MLPHSDCRVRRDRGCAADHRRKGGLYTDFVAGKAWGARSDTACIERIAQHSVGHEPVAVEKGVQPKQPVMGGRRGDN